MMAYQKVSSVNLEKLSKLFVDTKSIRRYKSKQHFGEVFEEKYVLVPMS